VRVFHVSADQFVELAPASSLAADAAAEELPAKLPATGYLWIGLDRAGLERAQHALQAALHRWGLGPLVDLHISDLLNPQLPSHFDYTSWYDLLVFRRLAALGAQAAAPAPAAAAPVSAPVSVSAPVPAPTAAGLTPQAIDTSPVGFAVYDRVLITVHPSECAVREHFAQRLAALAPSAPSGNGDLRGTLRLPASPADQMLRMVNHMVDSYLDLRRQLSRQLGGLQQQLLDPRQRFADWGMLLESRNALHLLEDICEDQRAAVQEWIDALDEWPDEPEPERRRERELLRVRSRDVLEHVERVLVHVRRLEHSAETSVQMHFSALSHRTNDIMRTLTVLTAIFLPLNLITGFFGMNFEFMPLIHTSFGFWGAVGLMLFVGVGLAVFFRRKRYLGTSRR
jgi:magnesium transporter